MSVVGKHLVFVYGTLKRGCRNHGWMRGGFYVGEAVTEASFRMYDLGGYPGMYRVGASGQSIQGELWRMDEAGLARLNILEDVEGGDYLCEGIALLPPWEHEKPLAYICLLPHIDCADAGREWME